MNPTKHLRKLLLEGHPVKVTYVPFVLERDLSCTSSEFILATEKLKHEFKVEFVSSASYRLSSSCHSWMPDFYIFHPRKVKREMVSYTGYPDRTGAPKRKLRR
jgi:hypothetical protein